MIDFFQRLDPETGAIAHDFICAADGAGWDTRFLGALYQDLSEAVRKRYALLQTPEFVEAFILDHTLTPALSAFGLPAVRLIDPTCGSGTSCRARSSACSTPGSGASLRPTPAP